MPHLVDRQRPARILEPRDERLRDRRPEDLAVMVAAVPMGDRRVLPPELDVELIPLRPRRPDTLQLEADLVRVGFELRDDLGERLKVIAESASC